jgi:HSP20 family molecular chaperone IbpA
MVAEPPCDVVSRGFKKEDFKVNIDNNVLSINAETKQETLTRKVLTGSIAEGSIVIHRLPVISIT